ncbi:PTS transporter subunit IIA-like nitrogen-regulatory protein PtsN [Lacticaseibacillus zeae DSM 20178 = KCTC 3804]|uniref:PTS transporter subunit IIA-like nitrogen-regulatory protein PtsN n=1 Tax=Lacticaseibacillus zeae DSM 20178 = KCTC 3804 TaxID=1423816 RepID=A0A0R1ETZ6_LACZE|nr:MULTISPECIES: PTS sugar transporter subunit IIA [Lacticaseibacillus]KLI74668.1 PTS lactose transporter subunit IIBC [Lacticaseibacillus casei]KRK12462.1 PTS transporter subunit IIA-like nitrogen-regulatory protein PtsN [Lacticaseibacillus zeae DSM 20178 = KCTC 3804]OLS06267.1 PTS lactose transporter subunit IIBC [Lacticaseibacillus casei]QVI32389.1 PTS sugar transporter subunit IIA [Lacticaseibacillus zeae]
MQVEELVSDADIFIDQEFQDEQEYFEMVATHLLEERKVKTSFLENILQREKDYPTGLNTGEIKVAIPHTDYTNANTTQLVVTTFKSPVGFHQMDDPDYVIPVNLAIMILFDNPEKQPQMLKYIMEIVQSQTNLREIINTKNVKSMKQLFEEFGG